MPVVQLISYIDIKDLELVTVLTPEFAANTKVRIYSATRDNMVKPADILYRRNPKTKTSTFYRVITADSIPYPSPRCSVVCSQRPYQLFLRMEVVTTPGVVAEMNEELEAAIALPF
jgi:hypothetical protein